VSDVEKLGTEIEAVLAEFPQQVAELRAGKAQLAGFLVGQVMKRTGGRADARVVKQQLLSRLGIDGD
jgi:Asp-tRNA(Asn)/Glu-tRNA(Gln) amidotransferase B subunit